MRRTRTVSRAVAVAEAAAVLAGCSAVLDQVGVTTGPVTAAGDASAALAALPVKGRAPRTGYDRDRFGPAWADVDRNGCDTRIILSEALA